MLEMQNNVRTWVCEVGSTNHLFWNWRFERQLHVLARHWLLALWDSEYCGLLSTVDPHIYLVQGSRMPLSTVGTLAGAVAPLSYKSESALYPGVFGLKPHLPPEHYLPFG